MEFAFNNLVRDVMAAGKYAAAEQNKVSRGIKKDGSILTKTDTEQKRKRIKVTVFKRPELENFVLPKLPDFSRIPVIPKTKNNTPNISFLKPKLDSPIFKIFKNIFSR